MGAGKNERGLFKCRSTEKMGDSCSKAHLNISVRCMQRFYKGGAGKENKEKGKAFGCAGSVVGGPDMDFHG